MGVVGIRPTTADEQVWRKPETRYQTVTGYGWMGTRGTVGDAREMRAEIAQEKKTRASGAGIITYNGSWEGKCRAGAPARQRVKPWPVATPRPRNAGLGEGGGDTRTGSSPTLLLVEASEPRRAWEGPIPVGYARRDDTGLLACDEVLGRGRCIAALRF